jgi:hypothetical protein
MRYAELADAIEGWLEEMGSGGVSRRDDGEAYPERCYRDGINVAGL